ncbi:MAG: hypothetical protein M0003_13075 [Acidithiobacillus sp.]|nr:hypothetical protein [Acidithiobacillus sp.]
MKDRTGEIIENNRYQPDRYKEIIRIAESQGIGKDMLQYIAEKACHAKTGDDMNAAVANLDWFMKSVGQVRPDFEADMRKNNISTVARLLFALNQTPEAPDALEML